jgi:hypothetical protein
VCRVPNHAPPSWDSLPSYYPYWKWCVEYLIMLLHPEIVYQAITPLESGVWSMYLIMILHPEIVCQAITPLFWEWGMKYVFNHDPPSWGSLPSYYPSWEWGMEYVLIMILHPEIVYQAITPLASGVWSTYLIMLLHPEIVHQDSTPNSMEYVFNHAPPSSESLPSYHLSWKWCVEYLIMLLHPMLVHQDLLPFLEGGGDCRALTNHNTYASPSCASLPSFYPRCWVMLSYASPSCGA